MFNSLRFRLIASYILIVLVCLLLIGLSFTFFLRSSIVIDRLDFVRLTELQTTLLRRAAPPTVNTPDVLTRYAATVSKANDVRVLFADRAGKVLVDSASPQPTDIKQIENANAVLERGFTRDTEGQIWAFVTQPIETANLYLVLAKPRTTPFEMLSQTVLLPLLQAALVGTVLSIVMALLISYWVARPLQKASRVASAIAQGDFNQTVPTDGPNEVNLLARSFNEMIERVQQSQQTQRDFVANVSHELRTPLTSIQGFAQAILDGTASDPETIHRAATVIHDETGRMNRLVTDLLEMARFDSQPKLNRAPIDLVQLLNSVAEKLIWRANEKQQQFKIRVDPLPSMTADADRLAQVFTNLLENAIKYTPLQGTVSLTARSGSGEVVVAVTDTGDGIPPEDLPRIFERFYRVDKARGSGKGYGLGLAITKDIVQAHGGTLRVESAVGSGTRFTVRLPVARPDETTVVAKKSQLKL